MKKLHFIILAAMLAFVGCAKKPQDVNVELVTVENEVKTIGSTQAYFECEFEYLNEITKALLVYCEDDQLKYAQTSKLEYVDGKWLTQMNYLEKKTKYYYRYEFYNGYNLMWTEIFNFTTSDQQDKPTVETVAASNITMNSASVECNVTTDGGSFVTERGICYSRFENPSLSDSVRYAGTGIGRYTCEMTNLTNATTYYIRAFATNSEGTSLGDVITIRTVEHPMLPTVTVDEVSDITINTAVCGGNVLSDGFAPVTERGICYATHEEPTVFDYKVPGGEGLGLFQCRMSGLEPMTTYHVRSYARNSEGYGYSENEVTFMTADETFLPDVITNEVTDFNHFYAIGSGEVVSDGGLDILERGICWSTSPQPTPLNNKLTAGSGIGVFECRIAYLFGNTTYYVAAFATNAAGTKIGNVVTFTTLPHPNTAPEGAIPSLFSVSAEQQVFFSQGNLQYQASSNTWRFAEHQNDYVGGTQYETEYGNVYANGVKCSNNNISSTYSGWIDLFGWATSGWNNNNHYYHPYDYESTGWTVDGHGYGYWDGNYAYYSMTGDYINSDWGVYNPISNGGNQAGIWRTLSSGEWYYLLSGRDNATYKRSKAKVGETEGYVLLPDAWIQPADVGFTANAPDFETNNYDNAHWELMENAGAVFFPKAGRRYFSDEIWFENDYSYYWSSSCSSSSSYSSNASAETGNLGSFSTSGTTRYYGLPVRLVQNY